MKNLYGVALLAAVNIGLYIWNDQPAQTVQNDTANAIEAPETEEFTGFGPEFHMDSLVADYDASDITAFLHQNFTETKHMMFSEYAVYPSDSAVVYVGDKNVDDTGKGELHVDFTIRDDGNRRVEWKDVREIEFQAADVFREHELETARAEKNTDGTWTVMRTREYFDEVQETITERHVSQKELVGALKRLMPKTNNKLRFV